MKINYRPEIDGLRAIAVGAVILYHAEISIFGLNIFKGGFIGVDIFFVISGYLITSILLTELKNTGKISLRNFYERRIRRIIPALIFVIIASLPLAWITLSPAAFIDFSKSILSSIGFISNFYFYFSGQEYAALTSFYKPFIHIWSLSVEEQYYILFPIILFFLFKYFKKKILFLFLITFLLSVLFADYLSKHNNSLNFYILPTRIWELIGGSIIAYLKIFKNFKNTKIDIIFPFAGLIVIISSIFLFNHEIRHPSLFTLSAIVGTMLILNYCGKNELITKILSSKLFVKIGLISYSLYLWHYPIFTFARITEITSGNTANKILLGFLILCISIFSYFYIEKPFRNNKYKFKNIVFFLFFLIFFLIAFNLSVIFNNGYKIRMPEILNDLTYKETHNLLENSNKETCLVLKNGCSFNLNSNKKIFLIGDSHAASLAFDLKNKLEKKDFQFNTSFLGDCGFFPGFDLIDKKNNKIDKNCNNFYFTKLKKRLLNEESSTIIILARYPLYLDKKEYSENYNSQISSWSRNYVSRNKENNLINSFVETINDLSSKHKIILIYPVPEMTLNAGRKLLNKFILNRQEFEKIVYKENFFSTSFDSYLKRTKTSFDMLDSIVGKNISRIYPHEIFCNTFLKNKCVAHSDKNLFYFDSNHLTKKGSELINKIIIKKIN